MTRTPSAVPPSASPAPPALLQTAAREAVHDISGTLCALQGYSFLLRRELAPGGDEADLLDCIDEAIARLRASVEGLGAALAAAAEATGDAAPGTAALEGTAGATPQR